MVDVLCRLATCHLTRIVAEALGILKLGDATMAPAQGRVRLHEPRDWARTIATTRGTSGPWGGRVVRQKSARTGGVTDEKSRQAVISRKRCGCRYRAQKMELSSERRKGAAL